MTNNECRLIRCSLLWHLIWVYPVCSGLSVPILSINGPAAEKREHVNSKDPDQPAHLCTGQDLHCSPIQYRDLVEDTGLTCANWSGPLPIVHALRAFLSASRPNNYGNIVF